MHVYQHLSACRECLHRYAAVYAAINWGKADIHKPVEPLCRVQSCYSTERRERDGLSGTNGLFTHTDLETWPGF